MQSKICQAKCLSSTRHQCDRIELYATNQCTKRATGFCTGAASRFLKPLQRGKLHLHQTEHPNRLPTSCGCPGLPGVASEFFTLTTQFAFGQGLQPHQLCSLSFPQYFPIGKCGDSAGAGVHGEEKAQGQ